MRILYKILFITILFASCTADEVAPDLVGKSGFRLALADNPAVTTRAVPADLPVPTAGRFNITVQNNKTGRVVYDGAFREFVEAQGGAYTLTATYGADVPIGIDRPYYRGTATATISETDQTPSVTIPCSVANALLSIRYLDNGGNRSTERFDEFFTEYYVTVQVGDKSVDLHSDEMSAYFPAGSSPKATFNGIIADNGQQVSFDIESSDIPSSLDAADNLILNLSLEVVPSGIVLDVQKAEVEKITVTETIPLAWLPAPKMAFSGDASAMRYEDEEAPTNYIYSLNTASALQDMEVVADFADSRLASLNGSHMLSEMTADMRQAFADAGIVLPEIGATLNDYKLDLNAFVDNLQTNNGAVTDNSLSLRLKANNRWNSDVATGMDVKVKRLRFTLPDQAEGNAWSKTLYIDPVTAANVVAGDDVDVDDAISNLSYELSTDGGSTWNTVSTSASGAQLLASGLTSGATYQLRARLNGHTLYSNQATQTMETEDAVPNGDFEDLRTTYNNVTVNQGGEYRRTRIGNAYGQNTQTFTVKEPTGWGSTNAKTCNLSASNTNSWFVPLSVFNTTIAFQTNEAKISGLGGTVLNPANYCNNTAQNGSNAMVVRNVAYSANGTTPGRYSQTAATPGNNYYSKNTPTISNTAAGKLFLGSYTFSGGTETFNQGVSFATRPTSLSGYYKYDTSRGSASDRGLVTITLLNGSNVIGTGTAVLTSAGDYTQFTADITYSSTTQRATSLRIMISSAQNESSITTTKFAEYIQEAYGSVLTVDNLTFTYDR